MVGKDKGPLAWLAEAQRLGRETTALGAQLRALTPPTVAFPIDDLPQIDWGPKLMDWPKIDPLWAKWQAVAVDPVWAKWQTATVDPLWAKWQAPELAAFRAFNDQMLATANLFQDMWAAFEDPDLTMARCEWIEEAGWLPHYTAPSEKIDEAGGDIEALDAALARHYAEHWPEVEAALLEHLEGYAVDDQAKDAFRQALQLHAQGAHTFCIRGLFPEIERIARLELHGGALLQIASLHELRKAAAALGPWETDPGGWPGLRLYSKLARHLYARVTTPEELEVVAKDPVPNRHAALHGLLAYSEPKNSINLLIMADFIFQVFTALKAAPEDISAAA